MGKKKHKKDTAETPKKVDEEKLGTIKKLKKELQYISEKVSLLKA